MNKLIKFENIVNREDENIEISAYSFHSFVEKIRKKIDMERKNWRKNVKESLWMLENN